MGDESIVRLWAVRSVKETLQADPARHCMRRLLHRTSAAAKWPIQRYPVWSGPLWPGLAHSPTGLAELAHP